MYLSIFVTILLLVHTHVHTTNILLQDNWHFQIENLFMCEWRGTSCTSKTTTTRIFLQDTIYAETVCLDVNIITANNVDTVCSKHFTCIRRQSKSRQQILQITHRQRRFRHLYTVTSRIHWKRTPIACTCNLSFQTSKFSTRHQCHTPPLFLHRRQ